MPATDDEASVAGVAYERRFGDTADFTKAAGDDIEWASFVAGLRA